MKAKLLALGLALTLSACGPMTPLYSGQGAEGPTPEKSVLFLDFVAENLPRNLVGQILPLEMMLFEVDPKTGQRLSTPAWTVGVCRADLFGCETGEIKTLRLALPAGTYAIGYLGTQQMAAPANVLMSFDRAGTGGEVVVGVVVVTPDFSGSGHVTARTPMITVRAGEVGYAGVLRAAFGPQSLETAFSTSPERRAILVAQSGAPVADRPGYYP